MSDPICPLCLRPIPPGVPQSLHHLIPKLKGGKGGPTVLVHHICHKEIHATLSEAQLARSYNTPEALRFAVAEAVGIAVSSDDCRAAMMEPVMAVEVVVADKSVGVVLNDITSQRRGIVQTVTGGEAEEGGAAPAQTPTSTAGHDHPKKLRALRPRNFFWWGRFFPLVRPFARPAVRTC